MTITKDIDWYERKFETIRGRLTIGHGIRLLNDKVELKTQSGWSALTSDLDWVKQHNATTNFLFFLRMSNLNLRLPYPFKN